MKHTKFLLVATAMLLATLTTAQQALADCTWTVSGKVQVRESETDPDRVQRDRGLKSIQIKVSGATVGRVYGSWGTVRTNSSGEFTMVRTKSCANRHLKVQARLQHSELKVKDPTGGEWIELYETTTKRSAGTLDIGTKRFTDGSGTTDLNSNDAFRRALAWYATKKVIDRFQEEDSYFDFKDTITIKYPAAVISNVSYANGIERTAFVDPSPSWTNRDFLEVTLHEVMHLWNYDHNYGMTNWLAAVWGDSNTHGFQENPNVAFHEGFAEYAMEDILHEIWGWTKKTPRSRTSLEFLSLDSLAILERNDEGVRNALHMLTSKSLYPTDTRFLECRASPNITFWELLSVFEESPADGYSTEWQVGQSDSGLLDFYDRSEAILDHFTDDDKDLYLDLLDVEGTMEASDACSPRTFSWATWSK